MKYIQSALSWVSLYGAREGTCKKKSHISCPRDTTRTFVLNF